ncbi:hypothetical protein KAU15_05620, partial [candidate division WOR-3 bacterium]|nr:hypothetical protein [candidate division WOR-3 bacterium]
IIRNMPLQRRIKKILDSVFHPGGFPTVRNDPSASSGQAERGHGTPFPYNIYRNDPSASSGQARKYWISAFAGMTEQSEKW